MAEARRRGLTRNALRWLSLGLLLAVLLYLVWRQPLELRALLERLRSLPPLLWAQLIGLVLLSYAARFLRWNLLLRRLGHRVPWPRQLLIYLAGFSMVLSPGKAGEALRSLYLQTEGVGLAHSLSAFVADRLLDLLSVGLFALFGLALLAGALSPAWAWGPLALMLAAVLLLRSPGLASRARRWLPGAWAEALGQGLEVLTQLLSGRCLARVLPLSLLAWALQGLGLWLCLEALGQHLNPASVVALYALALLAGAASFLPGGLGATEAALVLLLHSQGVATADALIAAVAARGLPLWASLALGLGAVALLARRPVAADPAA